MKPEHKYKTAVLLLNVGTPLEPEPRAVNKYLREFLGDRRVIDIPWVFRKILVNLLIVPLRSSKSTALYRKLWTGSGSPLLVHGMSLRKKLRDKLGDEYTVELAMNYGKPSLEEQLKKVLENNVNKIVAFPLFPQYASATTGSLMEKLFKSLSGLNSIPSVKAVTQYFDHPSYIEAMTRQISKYDYTGYDHVVFSFHGLPLRQVYRSHGGKSCESYKCREKTDDRNYYCYNASSYELSRILSGKLNIPPNNYTVSFQSRMGKKWLSPFTDEVIVNLAGEGKKRLLLISPSFTSDCLETIVEAGDEYKKLFLENGGSELKLVESLNDNDDWVEAISQIVSEC